MSRKSATNELDRAMNAMPDSDEHVKKNGKARTAKKKPTRAAKEKVNAPKTAFRVHTMVYSDKTKKYSKAQEEYIDDLAGLKAFVTSVIEDGQGNGLHEVAIHVR